MGKEMENKKKRRKGEGGGEVRRSSVTTTDTHRPHATIKSGIPEVQALPLIVVVVVIEIIKTISKRGVGIDSTTIWVTDRERSGQIGLRFTHLSCGGTIQSIVARTNTDELFRVEIIRSLSDTLSVSRKHILVLAAF